MYYKKRLVKLLYRMRGPGEPILFAMLITVLVVFMHRENIMRIFHGQESKLDFGRLFGKKKETSVEEEEEPAEEEDTVEEPAEQESIPTKAKKPQAVSAAKKKRRKQQLKENRRTRD